VILLPVVKEALETAWRKADTGSGREIEVARVEKIEERVLKYLGPDLEVLEVCSTACETANDGVGDVADSRLEREQVGWKAALRHLVLQELNQVSGNLFAVLVRRRVVLGLIRVITLNYSNDTFGIDWNVRSTDAVFRRHNQVWFPSRREVGHCDIVKTSKIGRGGVDLDDDLVSHLADLWTRSNTGSANDSTVLGDGTCLHWSAPISPAIAF